MNMMFLLGAYVGASYVVGFNFFRPNTLGSALFFALSPVTLPVTIGLGAIIYR